MSVLDITAPSPLTPVWDELITGLTMGIIVADERGQVHATNDIAADLMRLDKSELLTGNRPEGWQARDDTGAPLPDWADLVGQVLRTDTPMSTPMMIVRHGQPTSRIWADYRAVRPAFQVAIQADPSLVKDAMEQNIILVSPTTLLVALRTIDNLWRNERQNENAQLIAERAAKLYDKLRLFVDDMEGLGGALDKANQTYQGAMNKLATGRGNVIRQAESFKQLGVEVKRPISPDLAQLAQTESFSENASLVERHPAEDKVN